jgi:hypothetical protein
MRLRDGYADENDRDGARYLIDELDSAIVRGARRPQGNYGTRYRDLIVALEATAGRLGFTFRPDYDSLGALVHAFPGLATSAPIDRRNATAQFKPLLDALDRPPSRRLIDPVGAPATGWAKVDAEIDELRRDAATTRTRHDRAEIGRLCRKALISVADAACDESRHGPLPQREGAPAAARFWPAWKRS